MNDEINLIEYWNLLKKRRTLIIIIVSLALVLSIVISLSMPVTFKAQASILPIGGAKSGALSMAAQFGLLSAGAVNNASTSLMAILKSRTLAEGVIAKLDLMRVFYKDSWDFDKKGWKNSDPKKQPFLEDGIKNLRSAVIIEEDKKSQVISIFSEFQDKQLAADVANAYINLLAETIKDRAFTTAKRNRIFIEGQLEKNKILLLESGKDLSNFFNNNRVSNINPRIDIDASLDTQTKNKIDNDTLNKSEVEEKIKNIEGKLNNLSIVHDVPQQVYLQYLTLRRDLLGQINGLLTQQYEMAKIDESKEDINFQVIDWARVPERKFKPKRFQIVVSSFVSSLFLSVFFAFFLEYFEKIKKG